MVKNIYRTLSIFVFVLVMTPLIYAQEYGAAGGGGPLGNPTNTFDTSGNNTSSSQGPQGPQNYSGPGTPQEIKDAINNGGENTGEENGGDAEGAGSAAGESAGNTEGSSGSGEESGGQNSEAISAGEQLAKEAENAAAEAMKTYVEESAKLYNLEQQLEKTDKKIKEDLSKKDNDSVYSYYTDIEQLKQDAKTKNDIEAKIKNQKKQVDESKTNLEEKVSQMKDSYGELADIYNEAGDPVKLSTGQYVAEYEDFIAIDYITNFKIGRKLNHEGYTESFGTDWICPFDSRIAVCENFDYSDYIYDITEILKEISRDKYILTKVYLDYPGYNNLQINNYIRFLDDRRVLNEYFLDYYTSISALYDLGYEPNTYVRYGALSNFEAVHGNDDMLIFIDEDGRKRILKFTSKGYWETLDSYSKEKIKIYGKNQNGKKSNQQLHKWGYIVQYENGICCEFSNTGRKVKTTDRNGNEILYSYDNVISDRVTSLTLPTGEVIKIGRNQRNLITRIEGIYSGSAYYNYSANRLTSVIDNKGIKLTYNYDDDGDLTKVIKADGSFVQIIYGKNKSNSKVCTAVINENGNKETFQYGVNNQVIHTTLAGGTEEYFYNNLGGTVYKKTVSGVPIEITCDTRGRVSAISQQGNKKTFVYDTNNRVRSITNSKGGVDQYTYNQFGDLRSHEDSDGFVRNFNYDDKGNVISIYYQGNPVQIFNYNSKGMLIEFNEEKLNYSYSYNNYGQLIQKIKKQNGRVLITEQWKYDDKGRVVEYNNSQTGKVTVKYNSNSIVENHNGKKTIERFYDVRNRGYKIVFTDLTTKTQYTKTYILDRVGNITEVQLNGNLYAQYEYTPDNKIKKEIIWNNPGKKSDYKTAKQGIKTEFIFDSKNFISNCKKELVQEDFDSSKINIISNNNSKNIFYNYGWMTDGLCVNTYYKGYENYESYYYDCFGRLVKVIKSDGYTKQFSYTAAGRLLKVWDSNGESFDYSYKTDGSYLIKRKYNNAVIGNYDYSRNGLLQKITDSKGETISYTYDYNNQPVSIVSVYGNEKNEYDLKGRVIKKEVRNANNKIIDSISWNYNDENNSVVKTTSGKPSVQHFYDQLNREIKIIDKYGITNIEYDQTGNIIRKKFPDGLITVYEYTPTGLLSYSKKSNGEELIQKYDVSNNCIEQIFNGQKIFSGTYGQNNQLLTSVNNLGAVSQFTFDNRGVPVYQNNYDTGKFSFYVSDNYISIIDSKGYEYTKTVGLAGKITDIQDSYGNTAVYRYDYCGNLVYEKSFNEIEKSLNYDKQNNQMEISYSSGEYIKIQKNDYNQIILVNNNDYDMEYSYNSAGLLNRASNIKLSFDVYYSYDDSGRCVSKKSKEFEFHYSYDLSGNVIEVKESLSGCGVKLFYDNRNREIRREFSNGNVVDTGYSENLKSYVILRNKNGQVLHGDFVVYDANSRIAFLCNEKGDIRRFSYDNLGRLISVEYSNCDEIKELAYKEALECGMFVKEENVNLPELYLSNNEYNSLMDLIDNSPAKNKVRVQKYFPAWKEEYEYSSTGTIKSVKNPYGIIRYEYDYLNRITRKYCTGQKSSEITYNWNKAGNLAEIVYRNKVVKFSYTGMNQLETLIEEDFETLKYNFVEFLYDGLGRKTGEIINGQYQFEYIYDGLSRSILCKIPVTLNKISTEKYSAFLQSLEISKTDADNNLEDEKYKSNGESDVRTIDLYSMEPYSPYKQIKTATDDNTAVIKTSDNNKADSVLQNDYLSVYLNLFSCECAVINKTSEPYSDGYEINYCVQDYFGNVPKICKDSEIVFAAEYDVWGNSLEKGSYNQFSGKSVVSACDVIMYDFGSRLYLPEIKSFTSMDKMRMDGNWYTYCPTDPVNYKDEDGFYKKSSSKKQNAEYTQKISEFSLFDGDAQLKNHIEMGIPLSYDCADTTAAIDQQCSSNSGMNDYSPMAEEFKQNYTSGNYEEAKKNTSSSDYWNGDGSKTTKTSSSYIDLQNPEIVTPGTIIVTAPDPENGVNTGHTITVIARDYDENGNIKGIVYIEGHMGDGKPAETGYMYVDDECNSYLNTYNIKSWKGTYSGTYELESNDSAACYDEPKVNCGK